MSDAGIIALALAMLGYGSSTVLLRYSVLVGGADGARFYRALLQTVFVVLAVGAVILVGSRPRMDGLGAFYAALNGIFGGLAFILFTAGLEDVEASTAKPALVVSMLVAVVLGIVVLAEPLTLRKAIGVALAAVAVYLLST
ncbi:MAG: EamA family transporter [Salinirussus sp.]